MTQIATNIEQSKHLLELGLSHETADMFIENGICYPKEEGYTDIENTIPSWSLGALLEMMPCIPNCTILFAKSEGKYGICITPLDSGLALNEIEANTPFEVIYDMVVWLLESGYIKTEKK